MSSTDWDAWHDDYADPGSPLSQRLAVVQQHVRDELERTAPEPVRVLSLCAGDGRDLLGVLAERDDADRAAGALVELDARNSDRASAMVDRLGLRRIRVVRGDAGLPSTYAEQAPVDLLLLCGIFGNVPDLDVERTVQAVPQLCAPGALVLWTRHRAEPDLTPRIRSWFSGAGCDEVAFTAPANGLWSVGAQRFRGRTAALDTEHRLFAFTR